MGIFTCKSQCCASLCNFCANVVPLGYFPLGSTSRQFFGMYKKTGLEWRSRNKENGLLE